MPKPVAVAQSHMATDLPDTADGDAQFVGYWPGEDTLMIYDVDNHQAHIASDYTVPVGPE